MDRTHRFGPVSIAEKLNWLSYDKLSAILESYGFAINHDDSEDTLREAVRVNIEDGTIPEDIIND